LYLTLGPVALDTDNDTVGSLRFAAYNLQAGKLAILPLPADDFTAAVSPDGRTAVAAEAASGTPMRIVDLPVEGMGSNLAFGSSTVISHNDISYKRQPVFSPDGKAIAYIARDASSSSPAPDSWQIYRVTGGQERFVTVGSNPVFAPDSSALLYLRNDGLYRMDLASGAADRVWSVSGGTGDAGMGMRLALSHDGKTLVWSDPANQTVAFFTISSWSPFALTLAHSITPLTGSYAAFSPDDRYVAIKGVTRDTLTIGIFALSDFSLVRTIPLPDYSINYAWLSGWR
jgi:hypothetical protein